VEDAALIVEAVNKLVTATLDRGRVETCGVTFGDLAGLQVRTWNALYRSLRRRIGNDASEVEAQPLTAILAIQPRTIKMMGIRTYADAIKAILKAGVGASQIREWAFWQAAPEKWRERAVEENAAMGLAQREEV